MLGKIIYVLVKKCSSGWRYDESSCYFNVRIMLSLLLSLNVISILLIFFPKAMALRLALFGSPYPFYLKFIYPLLFFICLSIIYPKKQVLNYAVEVKVEKLLIKVCWLYCLTSIALLITLSAVKF
jgi:hypothetical protein